MKPKKTRATLTGKKYCAWELFNEDEGTHETQCGQMHYFPEGGISNNHYLFCPYCGRRIDEIPEIGPKSEN